MVQGITLGELVTHGVTRLLSLFGMLELLWDSLIYAPQSIVR